MLTNMTIGGQKIIDEDFEYLFNADFSRLNFMEVARKVVEIKDGKLIRHDTVDWKEGS